MAISKLILNDEVQMDVTSNTNTASNMLSGVIGTKNDGTSVTGNIATKTSSDLTVSDATVTAPAGYYANAASKSVTTTTHPNPSASITSSTGVVTASHAQTTGYVTGGTTTGTLSLTTQAGKTVTPTESAQTAVASYRWTTGNVNVAAISSTYVGTGVTTRSTADLTANGSVVTAPAGYYSTAATKTVAAGSAFPPAVTITKAPTFSMNSATGVITASYTGSSSITPTVTSGYITAGTAGTISTTGTSTYQLASVAATTYYPSTADQTISSYRWLTGTQTIKSVTTSNLTAANIASGVVVKVGDATNASRISQVTGTYAPVTSALTVTPMSTQQIFNATGVYGYKPVTINGDANLVASNIASGVNIFGVTGTYGGTYPYYFTRSNIGGTPYGDFTLCNSNHTQILTHLSQPYGFLGGEQICLGATDPDGYPISIYLDGTSVGEETGMWTYYSWTLPKCDIHVDVYSNKAEVITQLSTLSITSNGLYNVDDYNYADVNVSGGEIQLVHWVEV